MPRTFDDSVDLTETIYVSANPFTRSFCDSESFKILDEVWEYAWDNEYGTVLPRPVTDRAIYHSRTTDYDRMVVHYLQPHVPFLVDESVAIKKRTFDPDKKSPDDDWDRVTKGQLERDIAIEWYRETLRKALDEVSLLLSNLDAADVVITADHGEAFGEWGIYGHPGGVALPCLTEVPWVETTATDERTHEPANYETNSQDIDRDEQLQALGYK